MKKINLVIFTGLILFGANFNLKSEELYTDQESCEAECSKIPGGVCIISLYMTDRWQCSAPL